AAEMVAEKLDKKIRENLRDARNSLFNGGDMFGANVALTFQRPLLVVLDRNMDMATPLHHTWTYQALAHDVLDLKLNQVRIEESTGDKSPPAVASKPKRPVKAYDLNPLDKFWEQNKGNPFPQVAEAVQEELESYRSSEDEVKRLKTEMGLDGNPSNAAEMVAEKLDKKIRENLRDARNSLFNGGDMFGANVALTFQRPLLVVLDRNMDMATPLHHTWTYQALAHDVLDLKLNQVRIEESTGDKSPPAVASKPKRPVKAYDLNPLDKFWEQNKGNPFPQVAEAVQEELESYRSSEDEVKRLKTEMGLDGNVPDETISMMSNNTAKLTSAVSSLPELLEKKRLIDLHTTIATSILDHIKSRKLDIYFEIEEKIMSKAVLDKSPLELIIDPNAGHSNDKLRLFLIQYLCGSGAGTITETDVNQILNELSVAGCDLNPYQYIKRWKKFSKLSPMSDSQYVFHTGGGTKTVSMFSKLMSQGSQFVMEGVKNLVLKRHTLPITRIVDALMEMKSVPEADEYRYFDPKLLKADNQSSARHRTPFQDAIVFMVGGGNYIEYQNLIDYCKNKSKSSPKHIIYGTTDLMNANQFLSQLSKLGEDIH
ncbi:unnamed protein product, partial [Medioppia subpectinata]